MWHLYLDESGDLGFDFVNKKPSRYFTIMIMVIRGQQHNRELINVVKNTFKRKLNKQGRGPYELKGSHLAIGIKKYFFQKVHQLPFELYCLNLNKKRLYGYLFTEKERVYNFIARMVLDKIPFGQATTAIELIVDKSKGKSGIADFNSYIIQHLQGRIDPNVPLKIYHRNSHEVLGLQAVDLFAWGVHRKYEKKDTEWFEVFKEKIKYDEVYLP